MNFHQRRDRAHAEKMRETGLRKLNNIMKWYWIPLARDLWGYGAATPLRDYMNARGFGKEAQCSLERGP